MMTGNSNIPYLCYFQLSCFAKENTKQSDHAGRAAASIKELRYHSDILYFYLYSLTSIDDTATNNNRLLIVQGGYEK